MTMLAWPGDILLDIALLLLAVLLDRALPEPPAALHPVVWMGKAIGLLERISPAGGQLVPLLVGCGIVAVVLGVFGGAAWLAAVALWSLGPVAYVLGGAVLLRTTFTVRGLGRAAADTRRALAEGRLEEARAGLRSLVSRDTRTLTPPLVAAAAVESVAENTTDSYVGPWLAFAVLGMPGAVAYRAVNTLDSMLGYRGRYEYLGKASARLDDLVNLVPARLSALLLLVSGVLIGLPGRRGWRFMWRDHGRTASPNAGWAMSPMAGLLGVQLEKPGHYRLGDGLREPEAEDIGRAIQVAGLVGILGVPVTIGLLFARHAMVG